jgi:hypothetical protein
MRQHKHNTAGGDSQVGTTHCAFCIQECPSHHFMKETLVTPKSGDSKNLRTQHPITGHGCAARASGVRHPNTGLARPYTQHGRL